MKLFCCTFILAVFFLAACQKSSGIHDDEDTNDTNTSTEVSAGSDSTETNTSGASDSDDTSDSTESGSEKDTATKDTVADTNFDTEALPDPVENEWVFIEGGSFEMGSELFEYSQPVHTVTVPSFEIQKTEVTTHQFRQCVDAGECSEPDASTSKCVGNRSNWVVPTRLNNPVNCVTPSLAAAYCAWLGGRLPSEAEWEYAARSGGQDITYPWGNDEPSCDLAVMQWADELWCTSEGSLPVCSAPNGNTDQGLCDMAGNAFEWVADRVQISSDYTDAPVDGSAHVIDGTGVAIQRGGDSNSSPEWLHVAHRWFGTQYLNFVTFRCARDILK